MILGSSFVSSLGSRSHLSVFGEFGLLGEIRRSGFESSLCGG